MSTIAIEDFSPPRGKLLDITQPQFKANPFPFYAHLRAHEPVYRVRVGRLEGWLVTRYDDVVSTLKDPRFAKDMTRVEGAAELSKRPPLPGFLEALQKNMLDQDDPNHARLRALVHRAFTPARVEGMLPRIEAIANELVDKAERQGKMDLVEDFALPLPLTVIAELLGIPEEDRMRFRRLTQNMLVPPTMLNLFRLVPGAWLMIRYMRGLLSERRKNPRDDLLTALVQVEEAGDRFTEEEQVAMVLLLLVAGHETTVNLITSGMLALLESPAEREWLRATPEGIKTAVEELLRYTSPVETGTERYAKEDITLHGKKIRKGELVLSGLASANRDESQFPRPDELDLRREPNKHLAFGMGGHYCLGAPLARAETKIAINLLLQRLPRIRLAVPAAKLRWRATPVVRGLEALPIKFG